MSLAVRVLMLLALWGTHVMAADPVIYPFAQSLPKSTAYQVTVGGKPVFVHQTEVTDFASFAIRGATAVEIRCSVPVKRVVVRPLARGIVPQVEGNTIRFPIDEPGPLSVEINGKIRGTLLLFVDPVETEAIRLDAPGMRYFEGGKIHEAGEIILRDGETLYLGPGAVVRGTVKADNAKNIRILGPGILDGRMRTKKATFMRLNNCQNVEIRDVTVLGSYGWTIVPWGCDGVTLRNVKVFSWRDNDDGLDICSSRNVTVDGCFFRTKDDCIAIKAPRGNRTDAHDVKGVTIRNSVFWNAEWGNAAFLFHRRISSAGASVKRSCSHDHPSGAWATVVRRPCAPSLQMPALERSRPRDHLRDRSPTRHTVAGIPVHGSGWATRSRRKAPCSRGRERSRGGHEGIVRPDSGDGSPVQFRLSDGHTPTELPGAWEAARTATGME